MEGNDINTILLLIIIALLSIMIINSLLKDLKKSTETYLDKELPNGQKISPYMYVAIGLILLIPVTIIWDFVIGIIVFLLTVYFGPPIHHSIAEWRNESREIEQQIAEEETRFVEKHGQETNSIPASDLKVPLTILIIIISIVVVVPVLTLIMKY